jgi:hypothetical protein
VEGDAEAALFIGRPFVAEEGRPIQAAVGRMNDGCSIDPRLLLLSAGKKSALVVTLLAVNLENPHFGFDPAVLTLAEFDFCLHRTLSVELARSVAGASLAPTEEGRFRGTTCLGFTKIFSDTVDRSPAHRSKLMSISSVLLRSSGAAPALRSVDNESAWIGGGCGAKPPRWSCLHGLGISGPILPDAILSESSDTVD